LDANIQVCRSCLEGLRVYRGRGVEELESEALNVIRDVARERLVALRRHNDPIIQEMARAASSWLAKW